jgi:hypothetical protein
MGGLSVGSVVVATGKSPLGVATLGAADDQDVLTFDQAQAAVRERLAGLKAPATSDESMTVADTCAK